MHQIKILCDGVVCIVFVQVLFVLKLNMSFAVFFYSILTEMKILKIDQYFKIHFAKRSNINPFK